MSRPLSELVPDIRVINLDHRADRWQQMQEELDRLGIPRSQAHRFSACCTEPHGAIGCAYSHAGALQAYLVASQAPWCLVLEDDASFTRSAELIAADIEVLFESQPDWEVILLSGNAVLSISAARAEYHQVIGSQTASAYIVRRSAVLKLIPKFLLGAERLRELLPRLPQQHWNLLVQEFAADMIWKDLQRQGGWFILRERSVVQRPSYSDIEQTDVAYGV